MKKKSRSASWTGKGEHDERMTHLTKMMEMKRMMYGTKVMKEKTEMKKMKEWMRA